MANTFKRITNSGLKIFSRNPGLSSANTFVMLMVVLVATFLFVFNVGSRELVSSFQQKFDLSVYFKNDVSQDDILAIKSQLEKASEIKSISYITKEQALQKFTDLHKNDPVLLESLTQVGANPFLDSLNIVVSDPSKYDQVNVLLTDSSFADSVDKIDYFQRKPVIDQIFSLVNSVNKAGLILGIILAVISILVALNMVRFAISSMSEEISTMRLVGASNRFIRGPFVIQGIIAGIVSALIALICTFIGSYLIDAKLRLITGGISSLSLFWNNLLLLFAVQLATGVFLGIISSAIAVRRYLRI